MFVGVQAASSAIEGVSDGCGLDFSKLSPLFLRFLAWQRLNQVSYLIELIKQYVYIHANHGIVFPFRFNRLISRFRCLTQE